MSERRFYVYALYRLDGSPFYIGKGQRNRWLAHERECYREDTPKAEIIRQFRDAGLAVPKDKLAAGLTNSEAVQIEKALIAKIGRLHEGGPLTNRVAGGAGNWLPSPDTRARMSRYASARTPEHRANLGKSLTGLQHSPESIRSAAEKNTGRKQAPATVAKRAASLKLAYAEGRRAPGMLSPEQRAERSARMVGMPGFFTDQRHSDATREKMRQAWERRRASNVG